MWCVLSECAECAYPVLSSTVLFIDSLCLANALHNILHNKTIPPFVKVYPYEMLTVTNRGRAKLPRDVDRTRLEVITSAELLPALHVAVWEPSVDLSTLHPSIPLHPPSASHLSFSLSLQRHLAPEVFFEIFGMEIQEFDRLPLWKRNDMKKKAKLF